MSATKNISKFAFGLSRGIVAGSSAIAFGFRREIYSIHNGFEYETGESEGIRNFGHIVSGSLGISLALVSEVSSFENPHLLPQPVVNAILLTNGASFVFEVGKSIHNRLGANQGTA